MDRIPASERTRDKLKALMEGRSEVEDGRSELVRLAARLIIEEAMEGEAGDAVGREYYARGAKPGSGYRNGYRSGRVKSARGTAWSGRQAAARCTRSPAPRAVSNEMRQSAERARRAGPGRTRRGRTGALAGNVPRAAISRSFGSRRPACRAPSGARYHDSAAWSARAFRRGSWRELPSRTGH